VGISVPRSGGWRAWGSARGHFERRLAAQESPTVTGARIESETRRGRDYVRITISVVVSAPDVAQALAAAWWVFRKAASDDPEGWDMASAYADVRPEGQVTRHSGRATGRLPAPAAWITRCVRPGLPDACGLDYPMPAAWVTRACGLGYPMPAAVAGMHAACLPPAGLRSSAQKPMSSSSLS
jgi:hypothetical protein